jgi:hypothetical protein
MRDLIIKSKYELYKDQADRLKVYFDEKFSSFPRCEGRQYPQIITCLNALYKKEHSDDQLEEMITDGDGDAGFADAFVFQKDSTDIFDFKEKSNLGLREIQNLRNRLNELIFNRPSSFVSDDIRRVKDHLKKYHSSNNTRQFLNIYIIRKSFVKFYPDIQGVINNIERNSGTKVKFLSDDDIVNLLLEQNFLESWRLVKTNVEVLHEKISRKKGDGLDYFIVKIPLKELLLLYYLHIKEGKDLFAQNIRLPYKQNKFKNDLSETINKYINTFFLFHNGITIVSSKIYDDARNYFISAPQVVNGAQTIGNLYDYYKNDLKSKELKAEVICKIIKADQNLTDTVCETSNTQKAVKVEDLRVNDVFQKKLEIFINAKSGGKYNYIRKGKKQNKKSIGIKYTKFFQWAYSGFLFKPATAKNARWVLFEKTKRGEYEHIRDIISKNINRVIVLCDVGIFVEDSIKKEKNKRKLGFLKSANLHILAAMFKLNSCEKKDFNNIYKILKKYANEEIKNGRNLNYIFTKTDLTWKYLNSKI